MFILQVKREGKGEAGDEAPSSSSSSSAAGVAAAAASGADRDSGPKGGPKYPISSINILKTHGKSATESTLVHGYALNATRASQQMPRSVQGAKIALLDFNLQRHRMSIGVQVRHLNPPGGSCVAASCRGFNRSAGPFVTTLLFVRHKLSSCIAQVLVTDPAKLEGIRQREADITKEKIQKILAAGANVVLT